MPRVLRFGPERGLNPRYVGEGPGWKMRSDRRRCSGEPVSTGRVYRSEICGVEAPRMLALGKYLVRIQEIDAV